jgi:hypothetical protein
VDNSAPVATHPEPTYKSGKAVQTTGTTSQWIQHSGAKSRPTRAKAGELSDNSQ